LQEIGVRIAVGAQSRDILLMIFRQSVLLALAGTAVGFAVAYGVGRTLESLLAGVHPTDLASYGAGLVLILCTTLAGTLWPALRAVRVDPLTAIRAE
jgi:ABC-type antimicrobial peptide transport system permease subunit